jgi:2-hydroxylaminobenzoate mutase
MLPNGEHKPQMLTALRKLTAFIGSRALDKALEEDLNLAYGAGTENYKELARLLDAGVEEGWACYSEIAGPDYRRGRIADPSQDMRGFSIESGMMKDKVGNYHQHTTGEINMVVPVDKTGKFCGRGAGWQVFEPRSCHFPRASDGKITTLFLLPNGEIEYKAPPPDVTA